MEQQHRKINEENANRSEEQWNKIRENENLVGKTVDRKQEGVLLSSKPRLVPQIMKKFGHHVKEE